MLVHTDMSVGITERCMDEDRRWTAKELSEHTGISGCKTLRISGQDLKMDKISVTWVLHIFEVIEWTHTGCIISVWNDMGLLPAKCDEGPTNRNSNNSRPKDLIQSRHENTSFAQISASFLIVDDAS